MDEIVSKIQSAFGKSVTVTDIFKMGENYLVCIAPKGHEADAVDGLYEYDPNKNKITEFAMFKRKKEYAEAVKNRIYDFKKEVKQSVEADEGLKHYGKLGMKWGIRLYQHPDGSLTTLGRIHYGRQYRKWKRKGYLDEDGMMNIKGYTKLTKKDEKWASKNSDKIYNYALDKSKKELADYRQNILNKKYADQIESGRVGKKYINEYNQKMAEIMSKNIEHIKTPNLEKTVAFINKRGELGVYMSVSDQGYDLSQFKQGIHRGGRVAYKKTQVNQVPYSN